MITFLPYRVNGPPRGDMDKLRLPIHPKFTKFIRKGVFHFQDKSVWEVVKVNSNHVVLKHLHGDYTVELRSGSVVINEFSPDLHVVK